MNGPILAIEEGTWHGDTMTIKPLLPYPSTFIYFQDNINIGDIMTEKGGNRASTLISKELLQELYTDKGMSMRVIADLNDNRPENLLAMKQQKHHWAIVLNETRQYVQKLEAEIRRLKHE